MDIIARGSRLYREVSSRIKATGYHASAAFRQLETREKIWVGAGLSLLGTFLLLLGIFHEQVLHAMVRFSTNFRKLRGNWLIIFLLFVVISFPPLIGYSALSAFTGMVWGFPRGWLVLASGTLVGSFASFMTFRYILKDRAVQLAESNIKFMAFSKTLEQDSFTLLWMIRLCPLPYSLSNAAMSSIPSVEPWKFFVATAAVTPKLFLHIFIGDRLARLGAAKDRATWMANFLSIILAVTIGVATTWIIWKRTQERAQMLEEEHCGELDQDTLADDADNFEISSDHEEFNPFRSS